MRRRLATGGAAFVALCALLTGCSVPEHGGARLNADGTIDYVLCSPGHNDVIEVDYWLDGESQSSPSDPEWHASPSQGAPDAPLVVRYGRLPIGYSQARPTADPPSGWDWVSTPGGSFNRDDLIEDEWYWNIESAWAWIPNHPCPGFEIGPDGDPRRTSR